MIPEPHEYFSENQSFLNEGETTTPFDLVWRG